MPSEEVTATEDGHLSTTCTSGPLSLAAQGSVVLYLAVTVCDPATSCVAVYVA